jgi:hypothetical protein
LLFASRFCLRGSHFVAPPLRFRSYKQQAVVVCFTLLILKRNDIV